MRWMALLLVAGCAAQDPLPPIPLGTCTADAKLPKPPPSTQRSVGVLIKWANTAALVANRAIDERDVCRGSYERLNAWAQAAAKRVSP